MTIVTVELAIDYDNEHDPDDIVVDLEENFKTAIANGLLTGPDHEVTVNAYDFTVNEQIDFDPDAFHDYVTAHGFGGPTSDGYLLGHALIQTGDDYATAAFEIVTRQLTTEAER